MTADRLSIERMAGSAEGICILKLRGSLSLQTVPQFLQVVRAEKAPGVILDFSEVPLVDSAGVGALIQTHVGLSRNQRRLGLSGLNPRILAVLEVTRVRNLFPIFDSVADAEAHIL
jgi:anti-sigma B factor antagonist